MSLRIAVDARVVATDTRGIGRYERAVLRNLVCRDDVLLTLLLPEALPFLRRRALTRALGSTRFALARRVPRNADVVWHPANGTFFPSPTPAVVTLHDAVPFRYPNDDPKARAREQEPFTISVGTAASFVAVSAFGKAEIHAVFGVPDERIDVIHHGVDERFTPGDPQPLPPGIRAGAYFLFVGDPIEPRKNFAMLYEAYRLAWPAGDGPRLVVAGTARSPRADVIATDRLGDDLDAGGSNELLALYRGALAVTVPSYHETFGMPVIEAMACGAPVLASQGSCLPEIGGDAAQYVPPHDIQAWSTALRTIATDEAARARMRAAGLARAARFRWDASAQAHLDLLARAADARRAPA
ncbi:MAG TPA: glycosyltransferase family 1 protein [Candidatus Aquilonibacter sp.]